MSISNTGISFTEWKKSNPGGSYSDWKGASAAPVDNISPERQKQIDDAARSLNVRAQQTRLSQAEQNQLKEFERTDLTGLSGDARKAAQEADELRRQELKDSFESSQNRAALADQSAIFRDQSETQNQFKTGTNSSGDIVSFDPLQERTSEGKELPQRPQAPEGGYESEEDRLRAEVEYQRQLSDFYAGQSQDRSRELGAVSSQVADFGAELDTYASQINNLIASLNSSKEGMGDVVADALEQVSGIEATLSEDKLQRIAELPRNLSPEQIQQEVQNIVSEQVNDLPVRQETLQQVVPNPNNFVPDGKIITPNVGVQLTQNQLGQDQYMSPGGIIVPRNAQTGMPDFRVLSKEEAGKLTSLDVLSIEMATNSRTADLTAFYTAESLKRSAELVRESSMNYANQMEREYANLENRVSISKIEAEAQIELEKARLTLSKDTSMQSIDDAHNKQEAYFKAMLKANGLEGSSAAMAIMGANELKFNQQISNVQRSYDIELANLVTQGANIKLKYATELIGIRNSKLIATENLRVDMLERYSEIEDSILASQLEKITTKGNIYADYVRRSKEAEDAEKAAQSNAEIEANKEIWEREKWYADKLGYLVSIDPEGKPVPMVGQDGEVIRTMNGNELYLQMNESKILTENGSIIAINPYTNERVDLGNTDPYTSVDWDLESDTSTQFFSVNGNELAVGMDWAATGLPWSGSECVGFCRYVGANDLPGGLYTIEDKRSTYGAFAEPSEVQAGDVVFFDGGSVVTNQINGSSGKSGHAAYVTGINPDGTMNLIEANYEDDPTKATIGIRRGVPVDWIDRDPATNRVGIYRSENPPEFVFRDANEDKLVAREINTAVRGLKFGSVAASSTAMGEIETLIERGDLDGAKEFLITSIRNNAPSAEAEKIAGKEDTIFALNRIKEKLELFEANGGDTNVFTGLKEKNLRRIGKTLSPEVAQLGTDIALAIIDYRKAVSGAAFTESEAAEYERLFPSIGKTSEVNMANIESITEKLQADTDNYFRRKIGENRYNKIFGEPEEESPRNPYERPAIEEEKEDLSQMFGPTNFNY